MSSFRDDDRLANDEPFTPRASSSVTQGCLVRTPLIAGSILILIGFFFVPWVRFTPTKYMDGSWLQFVIDVAPGMFSQFLEWTGHNGMTHLLAQIETLGGLPAWILLVFIPTTSLWVRVVLFSVLCTGVFGIITFGLSFFPTTCCLRSVIGWLQGGIALLVAIWLLTQMPMIDALGGESNINMRLIATITGAHMGEGVWLAWLGLLLQSVGGPLMMVGATRSLVTTDE